MDMEQGLLYLLAGYLSGSVLYARVFSGLLRRGDVTEKSRDGNPGTANAFLYGGFWCGALTLVCDLLKGFLPVFLYIRVSGGTPLGLVLVMSAPALGHIFPIWHKFDGGKGIAVSFGVLLGLAPNMLPVLTLALTYLLFSLVFKVNPHFYRLILTYSTAFGIILLTSRSIPVTLGCAAVFVIVLLKIISVRDTYDKMTVRAAWKR